MKKIIRIFICTALPRLMWLSKIHPCFQAFFYAVKFRKFRAVIKRYALHR